MLVPHETVPSPIHEIAAQLAAALAEKDVHVTIYHWGRRSDRREFIAIAALRRLNDLFLLAIAIASLRPRALYLHGALDSRGLISAIPVAIVTRLLRRPILVELHGGDFDKLREHDRPAFRISTRVLCAVATELLVLAECHRRSLVRYLNPERITVVDNPRIPRIAIANVSTDRRLALFVGRLIEQKGAADLVAASGLGCWPSDWKCEIAGSGPTYAQLMDYVESHELGERVRLLGYLGPTELSAAYQRAGCFVFPSYHGEGQPLAVIDALAYGLPIVATTAGGLEDLLVDGENAVIVEPHKPDQIANAVRGLADNPKRREVLGRAASELARRFDARHAIASYMPPLTRCGFNVPQKES